MLKKFINDHFISDEQPFESRTLNFATLFGAVAAFIALLTRFIAGVPFISSAPLLCMITAIIGIFILSIRRAKRAAVLTTIILCGVSIVFWPVLFFTIGGPRSGMAVYFALALILDFTLLRGKARAFTLIMTSAVTVFCYASTLFGEWDTLPEGGLNAYQQFIEVMQSIFIVGFLMGIIILFQTRLYQNEKNKVEAASREIKYREELLTERLAQQQLMSEISKSFISKESMGNLISNALSRMGTFLNVDRVIIAVFEKESNISHPEYFWVSDPKYALNSSQKGFARILIRGLFSRYHDETDDNPGIYCDNTLTCNDGEFKVFYERVGMKSFICTPIHIESELWGVISTEKYDEFRHWNKNDAMLISTVASAISNAVARDLMEKERTAALEKALHASRAKGNFLSNMSHEIRTPMNAIIGMTLIGMSTADSEKMKYCFTKIEDASKHLLGIINDILDISKIEANKLELSPVSFEFEKMLQNVVDFINIRIHERRQRFFVNIGNDVPRVFIGDDQRLAQVITNLLSNAVKFTPEGGTITLDARLVAEEDGMCRLQISVKDTGIGITDDQKGRLFQSFEQAEVGTTRKYGGTGLGLSISKRIVEMMDGEIWVESKPEHGSKFMFTVLLKRDLSKQKRLLTEEVNWSDIRIFAADNEPEIREFFMSMAANMGISCSVAASGKEAVEMLAAEDRYDVYFIDWMLPGINGMELTRQIRAKATLKSIVVMFSSIDWNVMENDARSAGVEKFLPKPLFPSTIVDFINECIGSESMSEQYKKDDNHENFAGHTILLAEDVEINREIVFTLLEPTSISIEYAENGAEVVRMFSDAPEKYEMIFMDVQMPEMDGFEATRRIRALDKPRAKEIPIVAITANVFKEDVEQCFKAGMNDHVGKPFNLDEVLVILKKYLK